MYSVFATQTEQGVTVLSLAESAGAHVRLSVCLRSGQ